MGFANIWGSSEGQMDQDSIRLQGGQHANQRKPYSMSRIHENHAEEEWIYTLYNKGFEHAVLLLEVDKESKKYKTIITRDGQLTSTTGYQWESKSVLMRHM